MPLQMNYELHSDSEALWVDGVGSIAQYHCWNDMLYSHGVIYFLRDSIVKRVTVLAEAGNAMQEMRELITRLGVLNSKILAYETG